MLGLAVGVGVSPFPMGFQSPSRFASYVPGQTFVGESFARAGATATYFDVNGILQTAAANQKRDAHFIGGNQTMLVEGPGTNIVVSPRDLTNAAWVHTTMTPAKDQTGIDGVLNSASSILATAANATSLQTVVLGASTRAQQCWVKRLIGAGAVSMTMDNVTFTAIPVTGAWTKVTIPSQAALVNPVIGFKLAILGDKIAVDYVDNETGTVPTSPKIGTRNADFYGIPFPTVPGATTFYMKFVELGTISTVNARAFQVSSAANGTPRANILAPAGFYSGHHTPAADVASTMAAAPALGDTVELMLRLYPDGSVDITQSINGGAAVTAAQSAGAAFGAAWSGLFAWLCCAGTAGANGLAAFRSFKALAGIQTLAVMRAA